MGAIRSSETSVLSTTTRHQIPEDDFLHRHRRENFKSYDCNMWLCQGRDQSTYPGQQKNYKWLNKALNVHSFSRNAIQGQINAQSKYFSEIQKYEEGESNYKSRRLLRKRLSDYLYNNILQNVFYIFVLCVSWNNTVGLLTFLIKTNRSVFLWRWVSNKDYSRFWRLPTDAQHFGVADWKEDTKKQICS
jgi:hypothetical protein